MPSDAKWFAIRVRKSREHDFHRLVDMCGMEVEFLLLTEKTVRLIYNEDYEYTFHFDEAAHAANFVNTLYPASIKASR